eukprot:7054550-Pyramimonas_sp.AAC.1
MRAQLKRAEVEAENYVKDRLAAFEVQVTELNRELGTLATAEGEAKVSAEKYRRQVEENRQELEDLREGHKTMAEKYTK